MFLVQIQDLYSPSIPSRKSNSRFCRKKSVHGMTTKRETRVETEKKAPHSSASCLDAWILDRTWMKQAHREMQRYRPGILRMGYAIGHVRKILNWLRGWNHKNHNNTYVFACAQGIWVRYVSSSSSSTRGVRPRALSGWSIVAVLGDVTRSDLICRLLHML